MSNLRHSWSLFLASLLVGLFYSYCLLAILFCAVLWVATLGYAVLTSYGGGFAFFRPFLGTLANAIVAFATSLRLRHDKRWEISLSREEAPQLWSILEDLSRRLNMRPPHELVLINKINAWAHLSGVAKGRGRTRIGIGLDLLAGLTPTHVRAIMAHEMAHAKYVRRGYKGFIRAGMVRLLQCNEAFRTMLQRGGGTYLSHGMTKLLALFPKLIGKVGWRLLAACLRYDEFEADRVSAQICGSEETRSALRATYSLNFQEDRIRWRERLVHINGAGDYSAWLCQRLRFPDEATRLDVEARAIAKDSSDEMSTHPALGDRLAALENVVPSAAMWDDCGQPNALSWLQNANASAEKLLRKIEENAADQERKDSRSLKKWIKKRGVTAPRHRRITAAVVGGRNEVPLPIPSLVALRVATQRETQRSRTTSELEFRLESLSRVEKWRQSAEQNGVIETKNRELGARLRAELPPELSSPQLAMKFWAEKGAEFLERCEYEEATHCARLALENRRNLASAQRIVVVCHAAQNRHKIKQSFAVILKRSTHAAGRWAVAWSQFLLRDFKNAEAYLLQLTGENDANATMWALLGKCQHANSKPREALASLQHALELVVGQDGENEACHRLELAKILSQMGALEEAKVQLEWLSERRQNGTLPGIEDFEIQVEWLSLHLVHDEVTCALKIAADLEAQYASPRYLLILGRELSKSRDGAAREAARKCFERALESGYYPQALLSLSQLAMRVGDRTQARRRLFESLDTTKATPFDAVPVLWQLEAAFTQLRRITEAPRGKMIYFIARLDTRATRLETNELAITGVFASMDEAQAAAREIFAAILPGHDLEKRISVEKGRNETQPEWAVEPGMYYWQTK